MIRIGGFGERLLIVITTAALAMRQKLTLNVEVRNKLVPLLIGILAVGVHC